MDHQGVVNAVVPSVNLFLTGACNMRCKFCFAPSGHKQSLALGDAMRIISDCHKIGIEKITFVGGEPLLYPHLYDVVHHAHCLGLTTCVVTNGSLMNSQWLNRYAPVLDWVGMSVDSLSPKSNICSGRAVYGRPVASSHYLAMAKMVKRQGIRLKINTTVSGWTFRDDLTAYIRKIRPERWKVFQALSISGVNADSVPFSVADEEFRQFVDRHRIASGVTNMIVETANDMTESYLMVSPDGRLFDNVGGCYNYSAPIAEVGMLNAMNSIRVDMRRFVRRGGIYVWGR